MSYRLPVSRIFTAMKPLHYEAIAKMLLERFGEPIGDREAPPTNDQKKDMGNRGFGSDLTEEVCCESCGCMSEEMSQGCGCGGSSDDDENILSQKAPPGKEKMVKALKKDKNVDNPFAVAWAAYNKRHKK